MIWLYSSVVNLGPSPEEDGLELLSAGLFASISFA